MDWKKIYGVVEREREDGERIDGWVLKREQVGKKGRVVKGWKKDGRHGEGSGIDERGSVEIRRGSD